ncbi:c-type cytochrome [Halomonas sp. BC04]|uniref:c-type cytochrome n=1 Tax=Halomonas sp. BC04 TaxID=1403540 RepID=UPI0003ED7D14|nr:c-type cytochrome [Halomonas sp. BC04]EWH03932.1 hypothetical protein Q427_00725 [Halomonas sp. BC04]
MLMNDSKRPTGSLPLPGPVSHSLRHVALLVGGLALAVAITAPGQADASPRHDTGGHAHASPDLAEPAHGDDDHAHGSHDHSDNEHAHGDDDHAHGDDNHAAHGDDGHAHGDDDHAAHGDDGHAHGDDDHAAHGDDGHAHGDDDDAAHGDNDHAHGNGGHGWQAPQGWAERESPLEPDAETLAYGQQVYQRYCSACHGPSGQGDGLAPASIYYDPSPTNLALHGAAHAAGEYVWLIKEGGHASAMPRYQDKLNEDAIWSVVLYIRHELAGGQSSDHQH